MRRLALVALTSAFLLPSTAQANHAWACFPGLAWNIQHGTDGRDVYWGSFENDCYDAKGGNDLVRPGDGQDNILLGDGSDEAHGGSARDAINGQNGPDLIFGDGGTDRLFGGNGNDTVKGGAGADNLFGGDFCTETTYWGFTDLIFPTNECSLDGADTLNGGGGNDWIWESNSDRLGDGQVDLVYGGAGFDICVVEHRDVVTGCEDIRYLPSP